MSKGRRRAGAIAAGRGKAGAKPSVVVHSGAHAKLALSVAAELGVPVIIESPAGAGRYLGAKVFKQMLAEAAREFPQARYSAVLDCGDSAGTAMNALRNGVGAIRIHARDDVLARLADIAAALGARIVTGAVDALDLARIDDPHAACRAWLTAHGPRG
ncbi:MAG TPA: hypothetical protein QF804_07520 [Rhodospirillales bacterium]|nr:hypothetical protein [Rhodospirillales bacterium]HJO69515.1 hypothetical protein [Rhodospirillales bacterium]